MPRLRLVADHGVRLDAGPFMIRWHRARGAADGLARKDGEVMVFGTREEAQAKIGELVKRVGSRNVWFEVVEA